MATKADYILNRLARIEASLEALEFAAGVDSYEFARKRGSRDKQKRKRKGWSTAQKVGAGLAGVAALGAAARYGGAAIKKRRFKLNSDQTFADRMAATRGARGQFKQDVETVKTGFGKAYTGLKSRFAKKAD
jgi:hypothetical protein